MLTQENTYVVKYRTDIQPTMYNFQETIDRATYLEILRYKEVTQIEWILPKNFHYVIPNRLCSRRSSYYDTYIVYAIIESPKLYIKGEFI